MSGTSTSCACEKVATKRKASTIAMAPPWEPLLGRWKHAAILFSLVRQGDVFDIRLGTGVEHIDESLSLSLVIAIDDDLRFGLGQRG